MCASPRRPRMMAARAQKPTAAETNMFQMMKKSWLKYDRCCSPE